MAAIGLRGCNRFYTGTHGFYSTSFLFHIIGSIVFQFKHIHLGLDQNLFECTYELFLHSVVWWGNRRRRPISFLKIYPIKMRGYRKREEIPFDFTLLILRRNLQTFRTEPFRNFLIKALPVNFVAFANCLVIFHDLVQRHTNPSVMNVQDLLKDP